MDKKGNITAIVEGEKVVVRIIGEIGRWDENNSKTFRREIDSLIASGIKDAHVYINSGGGDCIEANEIVNIINQFKGTITGEGGALVASAATYIAIHIPGFTVPKNCQFMIHKPQGWTGGTVAEIESYLGLLRNIDTQYITDYLARATDKVKTQEMWNKGDWWMTAAEAQAMGFVVMGVLLRQWIRLQLK